MVAVLVAQDCVLLLVILVVRGAVEVVLALAQEAVTAAAVVIVMDALEAVLEAVPSVALAVARVVLAVVGGGVKEVVELCPIKERENGKR